MKNKFILSFLIVAGMMMSAQADLSEIEGLTAKKVACDNGLAGFTLDIQNNEVDETVFYSSCDESGLVVKDKEGNIISGGSDSGAPYVVATDGNFSKMSNGVITCKDSAIGETGTFDGVSYTTVDKDGLKAMADSGDLSGVCTSNVTSMTRLISGSFNQSLDHFDTSNVTDMSFMFYGAYAFNQPLDNFDTSNVVDMQNIFREASSFNQSLDKFDTSNVTNMNRMFYKAYAFNQPLDNFDTSNVVDMGNMFHNASTFNQPLDNFDTSNVTNMGYMFYDAIDFNQDLSGWDVSGISIRVKEFNTNSLLNKYPEKQPIWRITEI